MAIERCPHCGGKLQIPARKHGESVTCPRCQREFVAAPATHADSQVGRSTATIPAVRPLPVPAALQTGDENAVPADHDLSASRTVPVAVPVPPPPSTPSASGGRATASGSAAAAGTPALPAHGTARIIRPESIQPATPPEGKLPTLSLTDAPQRSALELPKIKSHPLVLGALLCGSLIISVAVLLTDFDATPGHRTTRAEAREKLRGFYEAPPRSSLQPYQMQLRQAQQAHSRGDHNAETACYRKVLAQLRAENRSPYTGLTGSPTRDGELEGYLSILLDGEK